MIAKDSDQNLKNFEKGFTASSDMLLSVISAVWYAGLSILGFFGNLLVLLTISLDRKLHLKRYVILASLSLCDLLFAFLVNLFRSIARWKEAWIFGMPWCYATAIVARTSYVVTVAHLCAVSYDRYKAIVKEPMLYSAQFTKRNMAETVLYLWILPAVITSGPLIGVGEICYNNETFICEQGWSVKETGFRVFIILPVATFIVPLVVMITLNYAVFRTARQKSVALPAVVTSQAEQTRQTNFLREHRAAIDVFIIVGSFLAVFLPLWVSGLTRRFMKQDEVPVSLYMILNDIAFSSAVCNPFVYAIRKLAFRRAMCSVLRCRGVSGRNRAQVIPQISAPARRTGQHGAEIEMAAVENDTASTAPWMDAGKLKQGKREHRP